MRRRLLFVGVLFAATTLLMALQKPLFLFVYRALAADASWGELWGVVRHGLTLDMTVAGYITALPLLAALVSLWLPGRAWRPLVTGYFWVVAVAAAAIFALDMGLFGYWGFRLDSSVLIYLATPREALASVTWSEGLRGAFLFVAYAALLGWTWGRIARIPDWTHAACRAGGSAALLLAAGLCFLAIRGGVSVAVANVSKVYFSGRMFLNHAAVNPLFSFLSTLGKGDDGLYDYEFFDEPARAARFEPLRGDVASQPADTLLRTPRPNVVLLLMESFGRSTVDAEVDGLPVAPNLRRLRGEGVWFEHMYASSFRTDRGTVAVLSGFPAQTRLSVMKLTTKAQRLPSIARTLRGAGYRTSFLYGGDLNFTNTASYLYGTGFERLTWQKDLHFDAPTSKWGYADDVVMDYFADEVESLSRRDDPFFAAMLTLSSHEPFDVPLARFEDPMLNSMAFADECLGRFVERMKASPAWDDLLIVVIADHAYAYPYGIAHSAELRHRIPMLWLGGAVRSPREVEAYLSQTDLAATLLGQMGLAHDDFLFSRDVMDPARPQLGYWVFNDGFGVADTTGVTIWDCTARRVISPDSSALQLDRGKALLQTTYRTIREL